MARRRGRRRTTSGASKELGHITEEYKHLLLLEAAARGPITPQSLREADRRLRRVRRSRLAILPVSPAACDAAAAIGGVGLGADALFGGAHPLATGTLTGFAVSVFISAAGIAGKWFTTKRQAGVSLEQ